MKIKRISALVLFALLFAAALTPAFAAEYTYGSGEKLSRSDAVKLADELLRGAIKTDSPAEEETEEFNGGYAYVSADAFVLGGDFILYPSKVEIRERDTAASVLMRALTANNLTAQYDGSEVSEFHLVSISGTPFTPRVNAGYVQWLRDIVAYYEPGNWNNGKLGELDFTDLSCWIAYINGKETKSLSSYNISDGDVVTLRFSLAEGLDMGATGRVKPYAEAVDLSSIVKAITEKRLDYSQYAQILNKPDLTQNEIESILRGLAE